MVRIAQSTQIFTQDVPTTPSVQQEITKFTEAENEEHQNIPGSFNAFHSRIANPYPAQEPSHILQRNFRIADLTWTPTSTGYGINFPQALLNIKSIQDALLTFKWLRADVQFEIRVNSTPYHIGVIQVSYLPCYSGPEPNLYAASGNRSVVLSIGTQNAATITIPYVNPLSWLEWLITAPSSIGQVFIQPLMPLVNTSPGTDENIPIQIFASFKNVSTAGYLHTTDVATIRKKFSNNGIFELSRRDAVAQSKESGQVFDLQKDIEPDDPEKEASSKGFFSFMGDLSRSGIPIVKSIGHFVSGIGSLLKAFSIFDKPNNVSAVSRTIMQHGTDLSHGYGLNNGTALSLAPNAYLRSPGRIDPGETSSTMVSSLVAVPMLHEVTTFTDLNTVMTIVVQPQYFNNPFNQPDYLMYFSDAFRFWRGSIKYLIGFYTTPFTSARFRVSINYSTWTTDVTVSGDVVSRIVDVKGDTFLPITVPYLAPTHWSKTKTPYEAGFPRLVIESMVPIVGQSLESDPIVYCVVWRGAGEDFRFMKLDTADPVYSYRDAVAQMDMRKEFSSNFPHIVDGTKQSIESGCVSPETIADLGSCLKRYARIETADTTAPYQTVSAVSNYEPYWYFRNVFLFWRGSRNYKVASGNSWASCRLETVAPDNTYGTGANIQSVNQIYPYVDSVIPWYCTMPYVPTNLAVMAIDNLGANLPLSTQSSVAAGTFYLVSAGDDFQYLYLRAPPVYTTLTLRQARPKKAKREET